MTYDTAIEIGVDLIAPAVTIFTIWYGLRPWHASHIGRAIMAHSFGSLLLFDMAVLTQYGVIPDDYPGNQAVTLSVIILWIVGWWYLVYALWATRNGGVAA